MSKKVIKVLICLTAIAAGIAGIYYLIISLRKKEDTPDIMEEDLEEEEEHLDADDALDLSSLKFSRHYVDLR